MSENYWQKIKDLKDDFQVLKIKMINLSKQYNMTYQEVEREINYQIESIPFHISEVDPW